MTNDIIVKCFKDYGVVYDEADREAGVEYLLNNFLLKMDNEGEYTKVLNLAKGESYPSDNPDIQKMVETILENDDPLVLDKMERLVVEFMKNYSTWSISFDENLDTKFFNTYTFINHNSDMWKLEEMVNEDGKVVSCLLSLNRDVQELTCPEILGIIRIVIDLDEPKNINTVEKFFKTFGTHDDKMSGYIIDNFILVKDVINNSDSYILGEIVDDMISCTFELSRIEVFNIMHSLILKKMSRCGCTNIEKSKLTEFIPVTVYSSGLKYLTRIEETYS